MTRAVFSITMMPGKRRNGLAAARWRLESLRAAPLKARMGASGRVPMIAPAYIRQKFAQQARATLHRLGQGTIDSHVLDLSSRPNIARETVQMIAGAREVARFGEAISAAIHFEDRIYQLTLRSDLVLAVQPWVVDSHDATLFEGHLPSMDVNWFLFLRPCIDVLEVDVARLLPAGIPHELEDWKLALWLRIFFSDEVNPGLPLPYDLNAAQQPVGDDLPAAIKSAIRDALLLERHSGIATAGVRLPAGPFGLARYVRPEDPALDQAAIARLAILVNMIVEDVPTNDSHPQGTYHPDLRPRLTGRHAVNRMVQADLNSSGHDIIEATARLQALYRRKRAAWLARWPEFGPDGRRVSREALAELDGIFGCA